MSDDLDVLFEQVATESTEDFSDEENVSDADSDVDVDANVEVLSDEEAIESDVDEESTDEVDSDDTEDGELPWDWQSYADQLIPIKVNGEERSVSLNELRDGFMMRSDYTQKTQKIAEYEKAAKWAEDVQAAFDRDPMGTLEAFARAYGLLDESGQPVQSDAPRLDDLDEDIRPWAEAATRAEQRAREMEDRLVQLENERIKNEIRFELDSLAGRFGEGFDRVAVLETAAQKNLNLEDAYWYLQGQKNYQQSQTDSQAAAAAAAAAEQQRQADADKRKKQKRQASGSSKQSFRASDIPADDFDDIGDLFEQIAASTGS